jgi:hypothetical protein
MKLIDSLKVARRSGVPLVAIETSEPAGIVSMIGGMMLENNPMLVWDLMSGLRNVNAAGSKFATEANNGNDPSLETARPDECLRRLIAMPEGGVTIMLGFDKVQDDPSVRQGIWNLRDAYKANSRTLVMLIGLGGMLPTDIKDDVVVLTQSLPDAEWLEKEVITLASEAGLARPDADTVRVAVDATLGLTEFASEQVLAMSLTKQGYDTSSLWERKRKAIEQTQGLKVWKGGERFDDLGGNDNIKSFFGSLIKGKRKPRCIVFIDEIEKAMSGQGDTSGTNQEMLGTMLSWMQDKEATGCILVGVAGSGKSAISKAVGNEANVPTIAFDLSAMKGSLVGESGKRLRSALATVDAISQGQVLVLATCNKIESLPPELRRRFTLGTFFFDLPSETERKAIWNVYLKRYNIEKQTMPDDSSWTGAEIKQCCDIADRLTLPLVDAASFVVPVARSASEAIESLRKQASGRYLSAATSGVYQYQSQSVAAVGTRKVTV